ncbi:MAG: hypothetical protein AAGD96_24865 [Chloroflexota bacterium]
MHQDVQNLIQKIHEGPFKLVLATAGAGTQALSDLLSIAGASNTLIESVVPYSKESFNDFVGQTPKKYVSARATRLLAGNAFYRAHKLTTKYPHFENLIGLACSASIATNRTKRGDHHAFIVTWQFDRITQTHILFDKEHRSRLEEETVVSTIMLNMLAEACGLPDRVKISLTDKDRLTQSEHDHKETVEGFLQNKYPFVGIYDHGRTKKKGINPQVLLPGSFNPLHQGHMELASVAEQILEKPVAFEISAVNVDKPTLPKDVILARIAQFAGQHPVYVTGAPTFLDKARLFNNTVFVIGFDTAERILMPKYYDGDSSNMLEALDEIRSLSCRFLVAGRKGKDGVYDSAESLKIPEGFADLFQSIPDDVFRNDISSSEIRQQEKSS